MAKLKRVWSRDTAVKVAQGKSAKYGIAFTIVNAPGGGFHVVPVSAPPAPSTTIYQEVWR